MCIKQLLKTLPWEPEGQGQPSIVAKRSQYSSRWWQQGIQEANFYLSWVETVEKH